MFLIAVSSATDLPHKCKESYVRTADLCSCPETGSFSFNKLVDGLWFLINSIKIKAI